MNRGKEGKRFVAEEIQKPSKKSKND